MGEASGGQVWAELLVLQVQREEGTLCVAAQRAAERLLPRTHHVLAGVLAVETRQII